MVLGYREIPRTEGNFWNILPNVLSRDWSPERKGSRVGPCGGSLQFPAPPADPAHPGSQKQLGSEASLPQELSLRALGSSHFRFCVWELIPRHGQHTSVAFFLGPASGCAGSVSLCPRSLLGDPGSGLLTSVPVPHPQGQVSYSRALAALFLRLCSGREGQAVCLPEPCLCLPHLFRPFAP